jgi:hypothetical protein
MEWVLGKLIVCSSKEFPCLLWNPNVYYHVYNSPPLVTILSQMNPLHVAPCFCKILPSVPRFSKWSLPFKLKLKFCVHFSTFLCVLYALTISSSSFGHSDTCEVDFYTSGRMISRMTLNHGKGKLLLLCLNQREIFGLYKLRLWGAVLYRHKSVYHCFPFRRSTCKSASRWMARLITSAMWSVWSVTRWSCLLILTFLSLKGNHTHTHTHTPLVDFRHVGCPMTKIPFSELYSWTHFSYSLNSRNAWKKLVLWLLILQLRFKQGLSHSALLWYQLACESMARYSIFYCRNLQFLLNPPI